MAIQGFEEGILSVLANSVAAAPDKAVSGIASLGGGADDSEKEAAPARESASIVESLKNAVAGVDLSWAKTQVNTPVEQLGAVPFKAQTPYDFDPAEQFSHGINFNGNTGGVGGVQV